MMTIGFAENSFSDEFSSESSGAVIRMIGDLPGHGHTKMRYLEISTGAADVDEAIRFYSAVFGKMPKETSADRATWSFADPELEVIVSLRPISQPYRALT